MEFAGGRKQWKKGGECARYAVGPGRRGQRGSGCAATSSFLHRIKFLPIATPLAVDREIKVDFAGVRVVKSVGHKASEMMAAKINKINPVEF